MRRFIAVYFSAFIAFMYYDVTFFRVGKCFYRPHYSAAAARSVTRVDIDVQGAKAPGAMIAGSVSERLYFKPAVGAYKSAVIFSKKLLFHIYFLIEKDTAQVSFLIL